MPNPRRARSANLGVDAAPYDLDRRERQGVGGALGGSHLVKNEEVVGAHTPPGRHGGLSRRDQLLESSSRLFYRQGYHAVSVSDVARTVGISAGAVYRHVASKQELLVQAVLQMVSEWSSAATEAVERGGSPQEMLDRLIASTVRVAIDRADVVGLWHREAGVIPVDDSKTLVEMRRLTIGAWSQVLESCVPGLGSTETDYRIRSSLGLLNCVPELRTVQRATLARQLVRMVRATLYADPSARDRVMPASLWREPVAAVEAQTRPDEILAAAALLFRRNGYGTVGVDEIGEASGIAGPSIYKHFGGKSELLHALLARISDELMSASAAATEGQIDPDEGLARLVLAHTATAMSRRDLVAIYTTEAEKLPAGERRDIERRKRAYREKWILCLQRVRTDLPRAEARVASTAVLCMIDAVARSPHYNAGPDLVRRTADLAMAPLYAVLDPSQPPALWVENS